MAERHDCAGLLHAADALADATEAIVRQVERSASPADIARAGGTSPLAGIGDARRALLEYRKRRNPCR